MDSKDDSTQLNDKVQRTVILLCLALNRVITAFCHTVPTFQTYIPPFVCKNYEGEDHCHAHANKTNKPEFSFISSLSEMERNCEDGYEFAPQNNEVTIATEWLLICDRETLSAISISIYFLANGLGAIVTGSVSDRFGRKPVLYGCIFAQTVIGIALAILADSIAVYTLLRAVQGLFIQGILTNTYTLMNELMPPSHRIFSSGLTEGCWSIGLVIEAALAYYLPNWRHLQIGLSLLPIPIVSFALFYVPESGIWLKAKNLKLEKTKDSSDPSTNIRAITAGKNAEPNIVIDSIGSANTLPKEEVPKELAIAGHKSVSKTKRLLKNKTLRCRLLLVMFLWFNDCISYYGATFTIPSLTGNHYVNFTLSAFTEILFFVTICWSFSKYGRRKPMSVTLCISGLSYLISCFITSTTGYVSMVKTVLVILGKSCAIGNNMCLLLYCIELFPVNMRGTTLGFCAFTGQMGNVMSPLVLILDQHTVQGASLFTLGALNSICAIFSFTMLPETSGIILPNTVEEAANIK